jgi:hypothetical protein
VHDCYYCRDRNLPRRKTAESQKTETLRYPAAIAREGLRGPVSVPTTEQGCRTLYQSLESRLSSARARFEELAKERAGSDKLREQVTELLHRWFIHGRPT